GDPAVPRKEHDAGGLRREHNPVCLPRAGRWLRLPGRGGRDPAARHGDRRYRRRVPRRAGQRGRRVPGEQPLRRDHRRVPGGAGDLTGGQPDGVILGPNMTTLTYRLAAALAAGWAPGDEVVVSRLDHDANVRPWVQAAARAGARVRWADVDPATGELDA